MKSPAEPCTARNRDGDPCRNYAMHGSAVCHAHGGRAPQVRQAAEKRLAAQAAQAELARLSLTAAPDIDPADALLRSIAASYSMCQHLRAIVESFPDDSLTEREYTGEGGMHMRRVTAAEVDLLHTWETLHARVCLGALKAGIEERRIRLAEQQASTIVTVLRAALADLGLDPGDHQVGETVARHLSLVQGAA